MKSSTCVRTTEQSIQLFGAGGDMYQLGTPGMHFCGTLEAEWDDFLG